MEQIDAHMEVIGTEATSNPSATDQPSENTQCQPSIAKHQSSEMATEMQPVDLTI